MEVLSENKPRTYSRYFAWAILILIIVCAGVIRSRLLSIPLERDEGEFAYMGQLILKGIPPYLISYNMKLPGAYLAYAVIMAGLGQTVQGIHLGLLLVNSATIVLVFLLTKGLYDSYAALTASAAFAILSISQTVLGAAAHATHFVLLFSLGGILLLIRALKAEKLICFFFSGLLLGFAFLVKQPGIFFIVFALLYLARNLRTARHTLRYRVLTSSLFIAAVLLPFGLTCIIAYATGTFEKFWFWAVTYAAAYGAQVPFSIGLTLFRNEFSNITGGSFLLWAIAGMGLIAILCDAEAKKQLFFMTVFLTCSFLAVSSGLFFRSHYFVLLLPAASLSIGIAVAAFQRFAVKFSGRPHLRQVTTILFLAVLLHGLFLQRGFLFELSPYEICRLTYGANPFPESMHIAQYIRNHTAPTDRIAVLGSEPQIYFYAKRPAATGYIYTYGLMEDHQFALSMQKEMIAEIENAKPAYIVFVNVSASWLNRDNSEKLIFKWATEYIKAYTLVGIADIQDDQTIYRWDHEVNNYVPRSKNVLFVFRRKSII